MRHVVVWLLATAFLLGFSAASAQQHPNDIGAADTIRIECPIEISPIMVGDSFGIPVMIWNDETLHGLSLGFSYNSDLVELVAWDLTGGVVDPAAQDDKQEKYLPDDNAALVGWIDMEFDMPIGPSAGSQAALLGTLYMKVTGSIDDVLIDLDSVYVPPAGDFVLVADTSSDATPLIVEIVPQYVDCGTDDIHLIGYVCGDVNTDLVVNVSDVVYLIAFVFGDGPPPVPEASGDVDCNGSTNVSDVVFLIEFVFGDGPNPCDPSGDGVPDC
jgi:hypothetical protein